MSLINQMLQDLDARRSEVSGNDAYGQQVRAVPPRRGVHPAWWVCLALAVLSAGLIAWLLLRPVPEQPAAARLPLRLDAQLQAPPVQPPAEQHPTATRPGSANPAPGPAPAPPPPLAEPAPPRIAPAVPVPMPVSALPAAELAPPPSPEPKPRPQHAVPPASTSRPAAEPQTVKAAAAKAEPPQEAAVPAATPIAKQVRELTPQQRAENEYRRALGLLQQGRSTDAAAALEQALQLDARHAGARQALVGTLLDARRQDEALRRAREGLALDPAQPGLAMIVARIQLERGEVRAAIESLERGLPHGAERADYQAFLAALLQRDGRHKQAVEHYVLALQRAPDNGVWWMGMGISLQADQRAAEAQEAFRRARASGTLTPELQAFVESRLGQLQR